MDEQRAIGADRGSLRDDDGEAVQETQREASSSL